MGKRIDIKGNKYGILTVLEYSHIGWWICGCACGKTISRTGTKLRKGTITHCGCKGYKGNTKHSMSNTSTYSSWQNMKSRCLNPKVHNYSNYGGRGITICNSWLNFDTFYKDMGDKPKGFSLDRKDSTKGYYKENCRWASDIEQARNRRSNRLITYKENVKSLAEWCEDYNLNYNSVKTKLNQGKDFSFIINKHLCKLNN